MRLPFTAYLDAISEEAVRLEDVGEGALSLKVPTCPPSTVEAVVADLADTYATWAVQVRAGTSEAETVVPEGDRVGSKAGGDLLAELDRSAQTIVRALEEKGPEAPCWNWSGEDLTVAWVARRMAMASALHRIDGELARGRPNPVERELAVDGVDERLDVGLPTKLARCPSASLGGSLCLVCTDDEAAWVIEVERARLRLRRGRGPAAAVLVGRASELFLFVHNRADLDQLTLTGDREVASAWTQLPS